MKDAVVEEEDDEEEWRPTTVGNPNQTRKLKSNEYENEKRRKKKRAHARRVWQSWEIRVHPVWFSDKGRRSEEVGCPKECPKRTDGIGRRDEPGRHRAGDGNLKTFLAHARTLNHRSDQPVKAIIATFLSSLLVLIIIPHFLQFFPSLCPPLPIPSFSWSDSWKPPPLFFCNFVTSPIPTRTKRDFPLKITHNWLLHHLPPMEDFNKSKSGWRDERVTRGDGGGRSETFGNVFYPALGKWWWLVGIFKDFHTLLFQVSNPPPQPSNSLFYFPFVIEGVCVCVCVIRTTPVGKFTHFTYY